MLKKCPVVMLPTNEARAKAIDKEFKHWISENL